MATQYRNFDSELARYAARELLKYAAGHAITCPDCGDILDAQTTVYAEDSGRQVLTVCARCWNRCPMLVESGSVTVYDGRVLFPRPQPKLTYNRKRPAARRKA